MTVGELKELLEDLPDDGEIRIMTQSNYPFENAVEDVWEPGKDCDWEPNDAKGTPCFYIVEGRQIGYGTKQAWGVED